MKTVYKNIGGSIFKNKKQMLVIVRVECSDRIRNIIAEKICDMLNNDEIDFDVHPQTISDKE